MSGSGIRRSVCGGNAEGSVLFLRVCWASCHTVVFAGVVLAVLLTAALCWCWGCLFLLTAWCCLQGALHLFLRCAVSVGMGLNSSICN